MWWVNLHHRSGIPHVGDAVSPSTESEAINWSPVFNIAAYRVADMAEPIKYESDLILVLCLIPTPVLLET